MIQKLHIYLHPRACILCIWIQIFNNIKVQPIWEVHLKNDLILDRLAFDINDGKKA